MSIFTLIFGILSWILIEPSKFLRSNFAIYIGQTLYTDHQWLLIAIAVMNLLCAGAAFQDKERKYLSTASVILNFICGIIFGWMGILLCTQ
jgi:hypothetical protein